MFKRENGDSFGVIKNCLYYMCLFYFAIVGKNIIDLGHLIQHWNPLYGNNLLISYTIITSPHINVQNLNYFNLYDSNSL